MFSNTLIPTYVAANVMYAHNGAEAEVYAKLTTLLCDTTWPYKKTVPLRPAFCTEKIRKIQVFI